MTRNTDSLRYLLLQIRDREDPIRQQEVTVFARALDCAPAAIQTQDLLSSAPSVAQLDRADVVLIGGSGDYSVTDEAPWLYRTLDVLRQLHARCQPTFASCWGFQAMARALGGEVRKDPSRAEVGTGWIELSDAGRQDPVFGPLGQRIQALMGHEDCVVRLPPDAIHLASSQRVPHQAFRFAGRPIYCTQFHPELDRQSFLDRVRAYPDYIKHVSGMSFEQFATTCRDTPEAHSLLRRFLQHLLESR